MFANFVRKKMHTFDHSIYSLLVINFAINLLFNYNVFVNFLFFIIYLEFRKNE